jgi:hypothetical protein
MVHVHLSLDRIMKIAIALVVLCAFAFAAVKATPHVTTDTLDFPSVPVGEFYDLEITNTDGTVEPGWPVNCGHTSPAGSGCIFDYQVVDTNTINVRMFNLGTSAANPPSQSFTCVVDVYE